MASVLDHVANSLTYQADASSPQTDTITISSGTNRKMIVFFGGEEGSSTVTLDSASFNGVSMTAALATVQAGTGTFKNVIRAFYLNETDLPTGGDYTLSMSFTVSAGDADFDYLHWSVLVFDDADQGTITSSEYDTATGDSTDTITFSTGVSVSNGDYVCASGNTSSNATFTITGYTVYDENMGGAAFYSAEKAITGSGTEAPSVVASSSETRFNGILINVLDYSADAGFDFPLPLLQKSYRHNSRFI